MAADGAGEEGSEGKAVTLVKIIAGLLVILFALAYFTPKPTDESVEYGVKVVSEIPLDKLRSMTHIALYNKSVTPAELTCKFELSAISNPDIRGYRIKIEQGSTGLYIGGKSAVIRGKTEEELLEACHVFACLRDGIECPNFMLLDSFFREPGSMSVILDENVGAAGGRGYAEIMGALSFVQSRKADLDGDGLVNQSDVDANDFFIYPFIKSGGECRTQPLHNLVQNWTGTNETYDCMGIGPAIVLTESNSSGIYVADNNQVVISGSDDDIHTGSIIIRDVIAPEWIRRLYGFK
ncbi:MAG: hypothetical protein GF416_01080 [Candidatus Altiarchaeales archaeon]|nr:hypothetical protein [Candidatus Altiarchaeales archaeon]MBD3415709.1 hypothetical protein [Candidatus Altiarchaeales archaeon]